MASIMAVSVPGLMGIHWWAKVAVESVWRGSTETILHPASRACARNHVVFVSCTVDAGFQPHMMIMRELGKSWRELCVDNVPYVVSSANVPPS